MSRFQARLYCADGWEAYAELIPLGRLHVGKDETATERKRGLWRMQELIIANQPNGRLNHRVLGFGQDTEGEVYVGATLNLGPSGNTWPWWPPQRAQTISVRTIP